MAALNPTKFRTIIRNSASLTRMMASGNPGDGAGKGGGGGGSIREAGGAFGKREAAQEDQYFRQMQADQLKNLKKHHKEEIDHHKQEIKRHEEAIKRHNEKMKELK